MTSLIPYRVCGMVFFLLFCCLSGVVSAQTTTEEALSAEVKQAVDRVRPALVRIHVVETYYREGRELKNESSGSGVVIREDGCIITNHHVAGHAKHLKCTFSDKEELEAELLGTDPLTDIAVIKLKNTGDRKFSVATFGDSDKVRVGDQVLAMGSPLALSQSVTLGIASNTEMTMPDWMSRSGGGMNQDGEDVGALVRWIGHDAEIFPGNSGGPLVNINGEVIGVNEIKMGLSGAIPGNLAHEVADALMKEGKVRRAWLGLEIQPRLKSANLQQGALVGSIIKGAPADLAGIQAGDYLLTLAGAPVDIKFMVQLPDLNRLVAGLAIGQPIPVQVDRAGKLMDMTITPTEREPYESKQFEMTQWGITVRDLSFMMAREMKRDTTDGVLVTSVRPGGPAADAKPGVTENDIIVEIAGKPVHSVADLHKVTDEITKDKTNPVPSLTALERKTERMVTVVNVGVKELIDPGLEAKKAWLPVETQVITRDIAEQMGDPKRTGFRVTYVYKDSTAAQAGVQVGDLILAVDQETMTASTPEDYEELAAFIRQYSVGTQAVLHIQRGESTLDVPVELVRAPKLEREMKRYRDEEFEFTVRDIALYDIATERWQNDQAGVLVEQVRPGGWAALGQLEVGDLITEVNGKAVSNVAAIRDVMKEIIEQAPDTVVLKVLRGIRTFYIELEPRWDKH